MGLGGGGGAATWRCMEILIMRKVGEMMNCTREAAHGSSQ